MNRSNYSDECEHLNLYRSNVERSIRGKRGQAFLRELVAAMDRLPQKVLICNELIDEQGNVCAVGAVCKTRGLCVSNIDQDDPYSVGRLVGISTAMAAEIEWVNDESREESDVSRWLRVKKWAVDNILK